MMDSKRLAVAFILWLIVSCVLLDYAEGFVLIGRQRQRKLMKRKRTRQTPSGVVSHPKTSKSWKKRRGQASRRTTTPKPAVTTKMNGETRHTGGTTEI